jgi:transposase
MKGQYEESEEIDVIERHFVVKKHKRKKYRCSCNGCIETALGPPKLFEGARYSIDFAIEVAVQKYLDHAPLERQVRIMLREGLVVNSQTLWDYLDALARLLAPAHEALHAYILSQKVIGADETRWRLMGAGGQDEGESKLWQAWAVAAPDAVCYRILASRSAQAGSEVLSGFSGILMADGYGVYKKLARGGGAFVLVHCWAHVRREFIEVEKNFPQVSEVLILIAELYVIESACPPGPAANEPRASLRNERSRPVVARIESWALTQRTKVLPESGLSKAIEYMLGMWAGLTRFIDDPRIPLDNNATERALRGLVVGRKNHYGSRSKRGTEVAALLYSLMESAKLVGIDPKAYLRRATHAALGGLPIPLPHEMAVPG